MDSVKYTGHYWVAIKWTRDREEDKGDFPMVETGETGPEIIDQSDDINYITDGEIPPSTPLNLRDGRREFLKP